MDLPGLLCAFLLVVCCCCRRATGVPGEAEQPTPEMVEVEVGNTALLRCGPSHSLSNLSHVDWFSVYKEKPTLIFRVRQGQGQSEPGEYQHRLSLQGPGALALTQVMPHDERIFLCQSKRPWFQEHRIQLRVFKAPEEPTIQTSALGISVNSKEPEEVATCIGRNGYPIPQVIWYKNRLPLMEEKNRVHIQSSQIVESSGLYTLKSVLKVQLVKEDKDAQFYCELSYRLPSGNHMKESREVTVPVFYPAEKVWLEVEPAGMLKEGDRVEIRCLADGNPTPPFSIHKQNPSTREMEEERSTDNGLLVLEPAQKQHSGLYECQGLDLETTIPLLSEPQELLVNYVSDVDVSPAAPAGQEGSSLTLTCKAESNQALEFQWLREKTGQVLEKGPVLHFDHLKREIGGGYRCVASVPSVPGLNRTQLVNVAIFGPPWMASKKRKVWVKENTMLNLSCEASGHPRPTISWNINGTASEEYQDSQRVLSTLNVLVTPELLERGAECTASNSLGRNSTIIILELVSLTTLTPDSSKTAGLSTSTASPHARANSTSTEKKLPEQESKGVVVVAVIVCILVLAVLGAILYFLYKKGKLLCGRSGKQEITLPPSHKSEFVVEVKSDKLPEEMGLLQGSSGDKRAPGDQGEKYIDLRH
ncbi:cell surface glycoprotein MUC18 isoform X1 [Marmota monax]|uniref:cell surface glycoprotein MUC18 isoform X1 n=1 Tax=Marmota monax TaxID=9995 RepID=UPI001E8A6457|nr:cell surface glycoprotein MUC18 isoform X1 [Marmota monax]XP_046294526.1 cell surface glycoprotein MUC18 isoform X1 [Marmota monax]XP_046294527.1 cell surface glycoprotein MUC18 isoform X1 [Marmota monax]KAI6052202.1 MCAM [Marmota monax]KAI6062898.1 MCAM [Marmota monax]